MPYLCEIFEYKFCPKRELVAFVRKFLKECEGYDSIVSRNGDKATPKNTFFKSFTPDITKMELFGESTLSAFFAKLTGICINDSGEGCFSFEL